MQIPRNHIVVGLISLTIVFLVAAGFLLLYIRLYNSRKKRHLQEKLLLEQTYQQELLLTQIEVQEQTFKTIAREIHDNVGQVLSLAKLTLSSINQSGCLPKDKDKVTAAVSLVDNSIKELRELASVLYADNLLKQGLEKAVEKELHWLARTEQFSTSISFTGTPKAINPERQLIAFRLIQEVLNNVIKHAKATKLQVRFNYEDDVLGVSVVDNGIGFDPVAVQKTGNGLGMTSLAKRAEMINGELSIQTSPGEGTSILLKIPYNS